MDVMVVVKGGMVRQVFSTSSEGSGVVLALDCPECGSEEGQFDVDAKGKQVEEMEQSPDWISVW